MSTPSKSLNFGSLPCGQQKTYGHPIRGWWGPSEPPVGRCCPHRGSVYPPHLMKGGGFLSQCGWGPRLHVTAGCCQSVQTSQPRPPWPPQSAPRASHQPNQSTTTLANPPSGPDGLPPAVEAPYSQPANPRPFPRPTGPAAASPDPRAVQGASREHQARGQLEGQPPAPTTAIQPNPDT